MQAPHWQEGGFYHTRNTNPTMFIAPNHKCTITKNDQTPLLWCTFMDMWLGWILKGDNIEDWVGSWKQTSVRTVTTESDRCNVRWNTFFHLFTKGEATGEGKGEEKWEARLPGFCFKMFFHLFLQDLYTVCDYFFFFVIHSSKHFPPGIQLHNDFTLLWLCKRAAWRKKTSLTFDKQSLDLKAMQLKPRTHWYST